MNLTDGEIESIVQTCEKCRMFRRLLRTKPAVFSGQITRDWNKHFDQAHRREYVTIPATPERGWKN